MAEKFYNCFAYAEEDLKDLKKAEEYTIAVERVWSCISQEDYPLLW